jgi:DNA helicase-2/ATP-dependent DNA helicase PcrA
VITAFEDDFYEEELDIKLLYVAMTRALHSLDIICLGARLSLMQKMPGIIKLILHN